MKKVHWFLLLQLILEKTSAGEGNSSIFINKLEICHIKKNRATEAILKIALDLIKHN